MSLYRAARLAAIVMLLKRSRQQLLRMLFWAGFALLVTWIYPDIASYLQSAKPELAGPALVLKTGLILVAFCAFFWELSRLLNEPRAPEPQTRQPARESADFPYLDSLADKPRLRTRRSEILDGPAPRKPRDADS